MSPVCHYCEKGPIFGRSIARRGLAKSKGGVGIKTTGVTKRMFRPNIQHVKAVVAGKTKTIYVCARCIKQGKVTKPIKKKAIE